MCKTSGQFLQERPNMAKKKYYSSKMEEGYGAMMPEGGFANMPQNSFTKMYPKDPNGNYDMYLNDSLPGIDKQIKDDGRKNKKTSGEKY